MTDLKAPDLKALGEFGLIARLNETLATRRGTRVGIGDDAALLEALQNPVVTCDCLVEGVHFRRAWMAPRLLGRKALAVNLSDLAAMGAQPTAAFVTLALGPRDDWPFIQELYAGMEEMAALYNLTIAGGDTSRSPDALMLSLTLIGDAPHPVLRSGAQAGDVLLVTGTLGDSGAGLALLQAGQESSSEAQSFVLRRHFDPTPRLLEMQAALEVFHENQPAVHAALDLSDGLAGDARHIAARSSVSLEIETARLPISDHCRAQAQLLNRDALDWALSGGEDYELLLCVAPERAQKVADTITAATGTPVAAVGRCVAQTPNAVVLLDAGGDPLAAKHAWTHF